MIQQLLSETSGNDFFPIIIGPKDDTIKMPIDYKRYDKEIPSKYNEEYSQLNKNFISETDYEDLSKIYYGLKEMQIIKLDKKIIDFCTKNELLFPLFSAYSLIHKNITNINNIDILLATDPEIENLEQICFNITINNEIEKILKQENTFYEDFYYKIDKDKQLYFVFSFNINES